MGEYGRHVTAAATDSCLRVVGTVTLEIGPRTLVTTSVVVVLFPKDGNKLEITLDVTEIVVSK